MYLNLIKNGTNREKTTQLISAVTSVLNVDKDRNKPNKYLKKSIEVCLIVWPHRRIIWMLISVSR